MESLYHSTNRLLSDAHASLERFHREGVAPPQQEKELQKRLEQLASNCERLDMLVQKEPVTRRQNAKIRVDQLKHDVRHLHQAFRSLTNQQMAREHEERQREQLLHMRFTTNAAAAAAAAESDQAGQGGGSETSILIDRALEHNNALGRSTRGVDDLLGQGHAMLENLREQRMTLKGIHKRMLDAAASLGMSSTVMRLIERRQEGDKYVLFGGMIITCLVMYLVIRFFV